MPFNSEKLDFLSRDVGRYISALLVVQSWTISWRPVNRDVFIASLQLTVSLELLCARSTYPPAISHPPPLPPVYVRGLFFAGKGRRIQLEMDLENGTHKASVTRDVSFPGSLHPITV